MEILLDWNEWMGASVLSLLPLFVGLSLSVRAKVRREQVNRGQVRGERRTDWLADWLSDWVNLKEDGGVSGAGCWSGGEWGRERGWEWGRKEVKMVDNVMERGMKKYVWMRGRKEVKMVDNAMGKSMKKSVWMMIRINVWNVKCMNDEEKTKQNRGTKKIWGED